MTNTQDTGWIGNWSPGIGDPNAMGWITVALYAATAVLCHLAARRCKSIAKTKSEWLRESTLWQILTFALWFLCVNKQLDLQTAMTELGRILARRQGWYGERRLFQETLIAGLFLSGVFGAGLALKLTWRMSRAPEFVRFRPPVHRPSRNPAWSMVRAISIE